MLPEITSSKPKKPQSDKKTPSSQIYLGTAAKRDKRLQKLRQLAEECGLANESQLIQAIADGVLVVAKPIR